MDALNAMKGYDKLNQPHPYKRLKATVMISAVLSLTLIIGLLLIAALIHDESDTQQLDAAIKSIETVCSVTQNPDSCFTTTLSSLNISAIKPDPEFILKLSLLVNVKELANITSWIKSLDENHPEVALRDCMDLLGDALSRLNDSLSEMAGESPTLTGRKVRNIQTWVGAAMTDEGTCLDGLEEMGSRVADEVKSKMKISEELLSYSLAIIANIQYFLQKFGLAML